MYKIVFEFISEDTAGEWKEDFLDNDGEGYTVVDAMLIAEDFNRRDNIKNARIEEM